MKTLKLTRENRCAIITIDHGKVNAIDTAMVEELLSAWQTLRSESVPPGIVLTGRPHCFSAGLDLFHQLALDRAGVRHFWKTYHLLIKEMVHYPAPTLAAITGYGPAGATILALCTDYRIMGRGSKHKIGMHEFVMSLQIPKVLVGIYATVFGEQKAWTAVMNKSLFQADEAVEAGLVHEASEVDEVLPMAMKKMSELLDVNPEVFAKTKAFANRTLRQCVSYDQDELDVLLEDIMDSTGDLSTWKEVQSHLNNTKAK